MKLSEQEITFLVEVDASIAGRLFINGDETARERDLLQALKKKGLVEVLEDGDDEFIQLTEAGQEALAENE